MNFIEKLSTLLGKQYLFKQGNGIYYNKYNSETVTKAKAKQWLFEMLLEEVNKKDSNYDN